MEIQWRGHSWKCEGAGEKERSEETEEEGEREITGRRRRVEKWETRKGRPEMVEEGEGGSRKRERKRGRER